MCFTIWNIIPFSLFLSKLYIRIYTAPAKSGSINEFLWNFQCIFPIIFFLSRLDFLICVSIIRIRKYHIVEQSSIL